MIGRKSLAQMVVDVTKRHQYGSGESPEFETAVKLAVQDAYEEILEAYSWPQLKRVTESGLRKGDEATLLTFESGESQAPLPLDSVAIQSIEVYSPDYRTIQFVEPGELFRRAGAQINTTGTPEYAAIVGQTAQYRRLATAGTLKVKSSVATVNDLLTVKVYYQGSAALSGRAARWEDVAGAFGTGINLSTSAAAGYPVEAVAIPVTWVGILTIEDLSGTPVEIVRVHPYESPGTSSANLTWQVISGHLLRLYPIPSADYKATITYIVDPPPLTEDNDIPLIPVSGILVEMATASMWRRARRHDLAREHEVIAEKKLNRATKAQQKTQKQAAPSPANVLWQTGMY
jgi:hypothetical protein